MMDHNHRPLLFEGLRARVHRNMVRLDADGQEVMITEECARALGEWLVRVTTEPKTQLPGGE